MGKKKSLIDWCNAEGEFGAQLLSEWTGIDKDGHEVMIDTVFKGSHNKMRWHCQKCNKEWIAEIHSRTGDHTSCKYCRNLERSNRSAAAKTHIGENDLLTWCNNHGEYGKHLLDEWVGQNAKGEYVNIQHIAKGSNTPVLWKCSLCNEIYPCAPARKTGKQKSGCTYCNTRSTSYPEQYIYHALKEVFPDAISRGKFMGYEYDITLPSISTYIEYSPTYTHKEKQKRDYDKALICKKQGVRFISIIDDSFNELPHTVSDTEICFNLDYSDKQRSLQLLLSNLFSLLSIDSPAIDYEKVDELAYLRSHGRIDYKDSVESIFPELVKEWHKSLNKSRKPSQLTPYAAEDIYWECTKCHYGKDGKWRALLSNRTHLKQGCPACGFNWYDGKKHSNAQPITIVGQTDFPSCYPELYHEWNTNKNEGKDPFALRCNSHKPVYWLCQKCGYGDADDWERPVYSRINTKSGCPACGYNCFDGKYHMTSGTSAVVRGSTDLLSLYPSLCKEWDYSRNAPLLPQNLKPRSSRKVYWICSKCGYGSKGEWEAIIGDRVRDKSGCRGCGFNCFTGETRNNATKIVVEGINDIASSPHKNILLEWHPTLNKINPNEIRFSSHDPSIFWECTKCHYGKNGEWQNTLNSRTNQKSSCPVCGYNYFDGTFHKTTGRSTILVGYNDLATTHPEYAKEWHPYLNGEVTPQTVKAGTHKEVYWQCPCCGFGKKGEWHQDIHVRLQQKLLCKKCRRRRKEENK